MSLHGKFFRAFYAWHKRLGLFLGLHLLVLILTGTLLIFKDELSHSSSPSPSQLSSQKTELSLQTLLNLAREQDPNGRPLAIQFSEQDANQLTIRMGENGSPKFSGSKRLYFDRFEGAKETLNPSGGFWDFILRLHREFLLGFYGKLYVGFLGFLFVLSLLSGLYVFGPTSLRLAFGAIRQGKKIWTYSDIHKMIGAGSFAWLMLIAVTGTLLATSGQLLKIYQYTELKTLHEQYPLVIEGPFASLDKAEASVKALKPESEISFITFPATEFATGSHFVFVVNDKDGWRKYLSEIVLVDGKTGEITEARSLPWYLKAAILSEPLHFGNYGGLPLKFIWMGFGLLGLFLSISGPYLTYLKRKKAGVRGRETKEKPRKSQHSPYLVPSYYGLLTISGCLIAMSSQPYWDLLSCVLVAIPLFLLLKKLIRNVSAVTR